MLEPVVGQQTTVNESIVGISEGEDIIRLSLDELTSGMGEPLFGLFIGGIVFMMLYSAAGNRIGPASIIMTLASSWLLSVVPPQYRSMVIAIVIVGIAAGVFSISQKYFLRPNA